MATASLFVEPAHLSVAPDSMAAGQLRIRNEGDTEERFTFDVIGEAGSWVSVAPGSLSVAPGEEATARIFARPPRLPSVRAGRHSVVLRVRTDGDRRNENEMTVTAEVDVAAFSELSVGLDPGQPGDGRSVRSRLTIDNRGNDVLRATIAAGEPSDGLVITADPSSVEIEPGGATAVQVDTRGPRVLFGAARQRPFTVVVQPAGGAPVTAKGSIEQAPVVRRPVLIGIVAVVVVALVAVLLSGVLSSSSSKTASQVSTPTANCPGAGHLAHDANGQIRSTVLEPDNFSFLFLQPGGCLPVRWNPCAPIHYVINGTNATPDEIAATQQAAMDAGQATGIEFVYDGLTTEVPGRGQRAYQPTVYPNRWAPVLISWQHLGGADSLTEAAGGGIPTAVGGVNVSGTIFLNVDAHLANNVPLPANFGPGITWGRILLHELGHVLGLGHVNGVEEIMHDPVTEQTSPTSAYGLGDLTGLRLLGKQAGCLTTPAPGSAA